MSPGARIFGGDGTSGTHRKLALAALALGALGLAGTLVGMVLSPERAFFSYLAAYAFALSTVQGVAIFLLITHAMGATWPVAVRRLGEAVLGVMPLLVVLYVPILVGYGHLYPWAHPERITDEHVRHIVEHRSAWLNTPFVIARALCYFAVWSVVCFLLRRWSFAMDQAHLDEEARFALRRQLKIASSVLLPPMGLTVTFAAFDWLMALSPDWQSTMYGVYYFAGGFLAALSLLVLLAWSGERAGYLPGLGRWHYYALGRLLLAFVIFWAYVSFFQFFLIWIVNRPVETTWYLERIRPGFRAESLLLLFGHFALPFFALLSYRMKHHASTLGLVAAWLCVLHYVDAHWQVLPASPAGAVVSWLDLASLLAVVGLALAWGLWRQRGRALAAAGDPLHQRALAYESH